MMGDLPRRRRPAVEGPGALPGPPLPGGHRRPPRQRRVRPARAAPAAYADDVNAADALAVLDATGTDVGVPRRALLRDQVVAAGGRPRRRSGCAASSRSRRACTPLAPQPDPIEPVDAAEQWRGRLRRAGSATTPALLLPEPHSTKVFDDMVGWALQTDAATITARTHATLRAGRRADEAVAPGRGADAARCWSCTAPRTAASRSSAAGASPSSPAARLVVLEGAGHLPHGRHPVLVNTQIKEFVDMHTSRSPRRRRRPGSSPASASAAPSGSARRSAWATCCATWPSPGPCASGCPTWRSSGWPSRR